ncbi:GTPase HflX, partial [Candidatus Bipolaricaulota bacterium]|nr:GTPase HflX [Candidatus Bipolaricaulota bacterium]
VDTAGIPALATVVQNRKRPDPATFIGKGKVEEVKLAAQELGADVVVFNNDLTPAQARNLEESLGRKVIDRTQLIMDIFAQRAATKEAKLQVELAQLRYLLPRLRGWGMALTRIGGGTSGGIGTRGPGETQLELDRNKINLRIHALERRLKKTKEERGVRRKKRDRSDLPQVALIGYTNSGKSTLLNRLCEEETFVEDKLFATLDTKVRRGEIAPGRVVLFADTVGFIRDLPHSLVPAFAATLEAARTCDLLLHVIDASKPTMETDCREVERTLEHEVFHGTDERPPMLNVLNKLDLCIGGPPVAMEGIAISAKAGTNVECLLDEIERIVLPKEQTFEFIVPLTSLHALYSLTKMGRAEVLRYVDSSAVVRASVTDREWGELQKVGASLSVSDAFPDEGS